MPDHNVFLTRLYLRSESRMPKAFCRSGRSPFSSHQRGVRFPPVAQMLAVLNTLVLLLMDVHRVSIVACQIRRFASHPDEALDWVV